MSSIKAWWWWRVQKSGVEARHFQVKTQNLEVLWRTFQWCLHCIAHVNISRLQSKHPEQYLLSVHLKLLIHSTQSTSPPCWLSKQNIMARPTNTLKLVRMLGVRKWSVHLIKGKGQEWRSEMTIVEFNEVQLSSWHSPHKCVRDCTNLVVQLVLYIRFIIDNFSQFDTQLLFCCRFVCALDTLERNDFTIFSVSSGENVRKTSRKWEWGWHDGGRGAWKD